MSRHIIVLDPGQGGSDPGSTECPGDMEDEANLDIAVSNPKTSDPAPMSAALCCMSEIQIQNWFDNFTIEQTT